MTQETREERYKKIVFFSVISQQDAQNVAANCSSITEKTPRERETTNRMLLSSEMENDLDQERWIRFCFARN